MSRIMDMRGDLQVESSRWLFKSPLAAGGAYYGGPTTGRKLEMCMEQAKTAKNSVSGKTVYDTINIQNEENRILRDWN